MTLEALERPPLFEVACAIEFAPIDAIDPVLCGGYWARVRDRFPNRETHAELTRQVEFSVRPGLGPIRTWLVSRDGGLVLQIQRDRFVMNWRVLGEDGVYPRFSSADGLLGQCLREFDAFCGYLEEVVGTRPEPVRVEALKVDVFQEGRDWNGPDDLALMMPVLAGLTSLGPLRHALPALRLVDRAQGIDVRMDALPDLGQIRLTTTVTRDVPRRDDLESAGREAGAVANEMFAALIPATQRAHRFGILKET